MLAAMSFNAYIFIAIIIGSGIGYFFFGSFDHLLRVQRNKYLNDSAGFSKVVRVSRIRDTIISQENTQPTGEITPTADSENLLENDELVTVSSQVGMRTAQVTVDVHS